MSTHTKMLHFKCIFLIFMKKLDFGANSGPLGPKKSGSGLKCGNADQSGGTGYSTNKIMINILHRTHIFQNRTNYGPFKTNPDLFQTNIYLNIPNTVYY